MFSEALGGYVVALLASWLPVILDVPWLVDTSLQSLPLLLRGVCSVCPPVSLHGLLIRTPVIGLGVCSSPG